jgi:hypothetical protein
MPCTGRWIEGNSGWLSIGQCYRYTGWVRFGMIYLKSTIAGVAALFLAAVVVYYW